MPGLRGAKRLKIMRECGNLVRRAALCCSGALKQGPLTPCPMNSGRRSNRTIQRIAPGWRLRVVEEGPVWRRESESNRRGRLCRPLHDHSAIPPGMTAGRGCGAGRSNEKGEPPQCAVWLSLLESGAGNESRTRDLNLGKVALYQLSYSRMLGRSGIIASVERVSNQARRTAPCRVAPRRSGPIAAALQGLAQVRPGAPQVVEHRPDGQHGRKIQQPGPDEPAIEQTEQRHVEEQHRYRDQLRDCLELAD